MAGLALALLPALLLAQDADSYGVTTRGNAVEVSFFSGKEPSKHLFKVSTRYDAWFGDEVAAANKTASSSMDATMAEMIEALLFKGAGELCSACKTAVEEVALQIETVRNRMANVMPGLIRAEEITGEDRMSRNVLSKEFMDLCNEGNYRDLKYSREYRRGCFLILGSNQFQSVWGEVDSDGPSWVPEMKRKLCTLETQVCHRKRKAPDTMSQCRQCAENMQDLGYILRRATRTGFMVQKAFNKKTSHVSFLSAGHWKLASEEVCETTKLRHAASVASDLEEHCVDLISEHDEAVRKRFIPKPGAVSSRAVRDVCVEVTGACTEEEFTKLQPVLESWHLHDEKETGKISVFEGQMFRDQVANRFNIPGTQHMAGISGGGSTAVDTAAHSEL